MTLNFVIPELHIGGAGTPPLQFFRKGFVLGGTGSPSPTWQDVILKGTTALTLVNAKADSLQYLKLYGGCEQTGTPAPDNVCPISCNNGTITTSYSSLTIDTTRILAYIAADNYWTSSGDSYTIRIPVAVGEKYVLAFTSTDIDVVGGIYRYGFTNSETNPTASGEGVRLPLTGVYRGSPQETPSVIVTAPAKYLIVQCSANKMPNNITNGLFLVKKLELSIEGTTETVEVVGKNLLDMTKLTPSKYINASGVITNGGYGYSDLIPVVSGAKYTYSATYTDTVTSTRIHGYKDGVWQQQIYGGSATNFPKTITIPAGVNQVRISFYPQPTNPQLEVGDTATTYEPYFNGGTATATDLLGVGTYKDVQSVLDGQVTRNIGIRVLNGQENDWTGAVYLNKVFRAYTSDKYIQASSRTFVISTHFKSASGDFNGNCFIAAGGQMMFETDASTITSVTDWTNWLTTQYVNGTAVIVLYPMENSTTSSVTPQSLNIQTGTNIIEITQASIDGLELEAKYKAGVTVTVEEIEDAQLSNDVTVTVS